MIRALRQILFQWSNHQELDG